MEPMIKLDDGKWYSAKDIDDKITFLVVICLAEGLVILAAILGIISMVAGA